MKFLKHRGDVRQLTVYKVSTQISVVTEYFVKRYIPPSSRTTDQMQQAARSCKQNIVEGSEASTTSKETEIKLTNVARASLGELYDDYLDFLNFRGLPVWSECGNPRLARLKEYTSSKDFQQGYRELLPRLSIEEICNLALTLIKQAQYMLDGMLRRQQEQFLQDGGIREQMTRARLDYRRNQSNQSNQKESE